MGKYWSINEIVSNLSGKGPGKYNNYTFGNNRWSNKFSIEIGDNQRVVISGSSISGEAAVKLMANYAMNNDINGGYVIASEPSNEAIKELTNAERQALIDNNIVVINAYTTDKNRTLKKALNNIDGVHRIDIKMKITDANGNPVTGSEAHVLPNQILKSAGARSASTIDLGNLQKKYTYKGKTYNVSYEIVEHYIDASGQFVKRTIDANTANEVVGSGYRNGLRSIKSYVSGGNKNLEEFASPVAQSYGLLTALSDLSITKSGTISSNLDYVVGEMNTIRKQERDSNFLTSLKTIGFSSADAIPGSIASNVEAYFGHIGEALTKLAKQTEITVSVAQAYADMDADLAGVKGEIMELPTAIIVPEYNADMFAHKDMKHIIYPVTAEDLDALFAYWAKKYNNPKSPLIGAGKYFIEAASIYGFDPLALVGICGQETGHGGKGANSRMNYRNFFGTNYVYRSIDPTSPDYKKSLSWTSRRGWTDFARGDTRLGILTSVDRINRLYYKKKGGTTPYLLDKVGYEGPIGVGSNKNTAYYHQVSDVMRQALNYIIKLHKDDGTPIQVVNTTGGEMPVYKLTNVNGKYVYTTDFDATKFLLTAESNIDSGVTVTPGTTMANNSGPVSTSPTASPARPSGGYSGGGTSPSTIAPVAPETTNTTEPVTPTEPVNTNTDVTPSVDNTSYNTNQPSYTSNIETTDDKEFVIDNVDIPKEEDIFEFPEDTTEIPSNQVIDNTIPSEDTTSNEEAYNNVKKGSNGLKTFATVAGFGAAVGAAGYGAYKYVEGMKERNQQSDNQNDENDDDRREDNLDDGEKNEFDV